MLEKLSLNQRMYIVLGLFVLNFIVVLYFSNRTVNIVRDVGMLRSGAAMLEGQQMKIKTSAEAAANIIGVAIRNIEPGEERQKLVQELVDEFRYEDDRSGYFFVYKDTVSYAMPAKHELVGRDLGGLSDSNGVYFIRELASKAREGGGFVRYIFPKPGKGEQPKLSYALMIPGSQLWIGTGVYLDNVEAQRVAMVTEMDSEIQKDHRWLFAASSLFFFLLVLPVFFFIRKSIMGPLSHGLNALIKSSHEFLQVSNEINHISNSLAESSSEQAASIEETSASLEEISSMTHSNADNVEEANKLMEKANAIIINTQKSMEQLVDSMNRISESSHETQKIVKTIDEIAFQTNILALNAAVEAARAGEAGAGFAVVAEEVRNLASRSAEAARNTATLIANSVSIIDEGNCLVKDAGDAFGQVMQETEHVGHLLSEVDAASKQQAQGISQVNTAVSQMDQVIQQNAANSEEAASSTETMNRQSHALNAIIAELIQVINGTRDTVSQESAVYMKSESYTEEQEGDETFFLPNRK